MQDQATEEPEDQADLSPEGRQQRALPEKAGWQDRILAAAGPGTRLFTVGKRVWTGVYNDGFIHAGNFAYMAILSLFPFFIAAAAILSAIGEQSQREATIDAFLAAVPPSVARAIGPVARDVVSAREGWLLWIGGLIGLWTASSLIETIRDILHRAYKTPLVRAFWEYRLGSIGLIFASVLLLLIALPAQVAITALEQVAAAYLPSFDLLIREVLVSRLVSGLVLFCSIYLLFKSLTPRVFQKRGYPKWPGALLVAAWWVVLTLAMPRILRSFLTYDLTYGSLAGVMIALFFFWLVGLGMVVGAELNAALAVTPEEGEIPSDCEQTGKRFREEEQDECA